MAVAAIGRYLMRILGDSVQRFLRSEDGPTTVEYVFMMALILLVVIASVGTLGQTVSDSLQASADKL
jgi:pilus assembly protein Flp/PilA